MISLLHAQKLNVYGKTINISKNAFKYNRNAVFNMILPQISSYYNANCSYRKTS